MPIIRVRVGESTVELTQGDITHEATDAIVNAANNSLLGGGGVDGAIHRAAGPDLLALTRTLGGCATGDAKITPGFRLPAPHVIHTVGPIYRSGDDSVRALLASAYRRSLEVAVDNGLRSISFPSLSTGAYGYPLEEAAPIALDTVTSFLRDRSTTMVVRFVLYDARAFDAYRRALERLAQARADVRISDQGEV